MSLTHSSAQTAKTVSGFQDPALMSANLADHAGPSAAVADTLSLPPEFPDAIRDVCHPCHPLSGAIAITLVGAQLNMADPVGASGRRNSRAPEASAGMNQHVRGHFGGRVTEIPVLSPGFDLQSVRSESDEDHGVDADAGAVVAVQGRWVPSRDRAPSPGRRGHLRRGASRPALRPLGHPAPSAGPEAVRRGESANRQSPLVEGPRPGTGALPAARDLPGTGCGHPRVQPGLVPLRRRGLQASRGREHGVA